MYMQPCAICWQKVKEAGKEDDPTVVKTRSVCLIHGEAKQTKMSELEQINVYCRAEQGEWVACTQETQTPQRPFNKGFKDSVMVGDHLMND